MNKRTFTENKLYIVLGVLVVSVILLIGLFWGISSRNENPSTEGSFAESMQSETESSPIHGNKPEDTTTPEKPSTDSPATTPQTPETTEQKVERILSGMTLEEKIYQMFVVWPETISQTSTVTSVDASFKENLEKYPVGGFIYMASNLVDTTQTKNMLSTTQSYGEEINGLPLFLCVDEEGGRVANVANNSAFGVENVGSMADIESAEEAYGAGAYIGSYLKELGFNFDFAPDADVITNSKNQVIGDRSFGTDADIVTEYAVAFSNGLHSQGILSTFKHFPGHGATEGDTHEGYAFTNKTYEELMQAELKPFLAAKENGVDAVMVAHISVPNVIGDNTPCTLSMKMVTEILRGKIGYEGLVVTDALAMGAIVKQYTSDVAAVRSIQAGADILLMPKDFKAAVEGVKNAVADGSISEDRINESVRRIIRVKLGL